MRNTRTSAVAIRSSAQPTEGASNPSFRLPAGHLASRMPIGCSIDAIAPPHQRDNPRILCATTHSGDAPGTVGGCHRPIAGTWPCERPELFGAVAARHHESLTIRRYGRRLPGVRSPGLLGDRHDHLVQDLSILVLRWSREHGL